MSISIIEPRNPRNHVPKFQAKFGVAEEEPDGPGERFVDSVNTNAVVYNATHEQETAMVADSDARRSGVYWGRSL